MKHGFLNRIGRHDEEVDEDEAIREHLEVLLNAHIGESATVPDFGLPDLTNLMRDFPEGVNRLEKSIRDLVARYEKRLDSVRVRLAPSGKGDRLFFEVVARRRDVPKKRFRARTEMTSNGQFRTSRDV